MVYIGLNDVDVEGNLVWGNGEDFSFNNINPCSFCNENSEELDYVIMAPWDGSWSFSSQWNARKYIVEIPCNAAPPSSFCGYQQSQPYDDKITDCIGMDESMLPPPNASIDGGSYEIIPFSQFATGNDRIRKLDANGNLIWEEQLNYG